MATTNASINFFLGVDPVPSGSAHISLYTIGSSSGYTYDYSTINLFLEGATFEDGYLNLYTSGDPNPIANSGALNLYLYGQAYESSDNFPLYTIGATGSGVYTYSNFNMFAQGLGILSGYIPFSGTMNLYIRGPFGASSGIDLSMPNVYASGYSSFNIYLGAIQDVVASGIDLYAYGLGESTKSVDLFTRGYNAS